MIRKADQRSADTRGVFLIITVVGLKTSRVSIVGEDSLCPVGTNLTNMLHLEVYDRLEPDFPAKIMI